MKFVKVTTKHTDEEIDNMIAQLDTVSFELMLSLYESFKYIEVHNEDKHSVMYAEIEEKQLEKLMLHFLRQGVDFLYEDITKSILYGEVPKLEKEEDVTKLKAIIDVFVDENLDTDVVLDKISEIGYNQLTERDIRVLQAH